MPCKRRCVSWFPQLKHRHRVIVMIVTVKLTQSGLTQSQSVGEPHDTIFTVSDELSLESPIKSVKCVTTIPCIDPADLSINFRLTEQKSPHIRLKHHPNAKLFTRNHTMCFAEKSAGCVPDVRIEVSDAA